MSEQTVEEFIASLPEDAQHAFRLAGAIFDALVVRDSNLPVSFHPEPLGELDAEKIFDDFAQLVEPGLAPAPKSVPGAPDAIAFSVLEGVLETEQVEIDWKSPRAIVVAFSPADGGWRFAGYLKMEWSSPDGPTYSY